MKNEQISKQRRVFIAYSNVFVRLRLISGVKHSGVPPLRLTVNMNTYQTPNRCSRSADYMRTERRPGRSVNSARAHQERSSLPAALCLQKSAKSDQNRRRRAGRPRQPTEFTSIYNYGTIRSRLLRLISNLSLLSKWGGAHTLKRK